MGSVERGGTKEGGTACTKRDFAVKGGRRAIIERRRKRGEKIVTIDKG
jgi:hypothetical protein